MTAIVVYGSWLYAVTFMDLRFTGRGLSSQPVRFHVT